MTDPASPGYAAAMTELEGILDELERDDLDVDLLADHVKRASELITLCRARIARAQADVDQIVVDLESFALVANGADAASADDEDSDW
jgi:exodeoxyribonuclease VII small subunit